MHTYHRAGCGNRGAHERRVTARVATAPCTRRTARLAGAALVVLLLAVVLCLLAASTADAAVYTAWSQKQEVPGLTERTIWSRAQVAVYQLPGNVNHTGYVHVELTYKPGDEGMSLFLLDADGQVCPGTESQGQLGTWASRRVVDYHVSAIHDQSWSPEYDTIVGDPYYVVVQALNGSHKVRLRGYYPRLVPGETDVEADGTLMRQAVVWPTPASSWKTVYGAPYGGAFDFKPTSEGTVECRLQYPADPVAKTVDEPFTPGPPPAPLMPCDYSQYVLPTDWDGDWDDAPLRDADITGLTHWDLYDLQHWPGAPVWAGEYYGLGGPEARFTVEKETDAPPNVTYHYVPVLWLASSVPALGPAAPPATGVTTKGYKATVLIPQNLYLAKAPARVKKGRSATLRGSLAVPDRPGPSATVSWALPGARVAVQFKGRTGGWKTVKTVAVPTTATTGGWSATVRPSRTGSWRAFWRSADPQYARVTLQRDGNQVYQGDAVVNDTLPTIDPVFNVALLTAGGVQFELLGGRQFEDDSTLVTVPVGTPVTRTIKGSGEVYTFNVASVTYAQEYSLAKKITVRR